jgi:phosphatidate phosphatase APP1
MKMKLIAAGFAAALALVPAASARPQHASHGRGQLLAAAATYLGLDKATLAADLKAGQSLAQVATSTGKTADGLVTALLAPAKLRLDAAVAAGRITAAQESAALARLQTALTNLVNRVATPAHATQPRLRIGPAAILRPALTYLGLDLKGVVTQLRAGKTLAQIAVAQNKTAQGLVDAIVASVTTKLDARVAAGKLTSAQESSFLATLQTNVTAFVNGTH